MLKFLGLSWDGEGARPLPPDRLQVKHLTSGKPVFQAHSGVPVTSDSLAYEPVQRLLAVRTASSAAGSNEQHWESAVHTALFKC